MRECLRAIADLRQHCKDLRSRVLSVVARGVVQLTEDNHGLRQVQVALLAQETRSDIEHMESFGFSAVPMKGAEALLVFVGGNRDHPLIVSTPDRATRPQTLNPGESCVYAAFQQAILLDKDGSVALTTQTGTGNVIITAQNANVNVTAPNGTVTVKVGAVSLTVSQQGIAVVGNLSVQGAVTATGPISGNGG